MCWRYSRPESDILRLAQDARTEVRAQRLPRVQLDRLAEQFLQQAGESEELPGANPTSVPPAACAGRVAAETPRPAAPGPAFRRVGQKTFKRDAEGFYVDTAFRADAKLPVVEVTAGSKEYVALLDSVKDLAQYFRLSDRLVVVLGETVYRVVPHA